MQALQHKINYLIRTAWVISFHVGLYWVKKDHCQCLHGLFIIATTSWSKQDWALLGQLKLLCSVLLQNHYIFMQVAQYPEKSTVLSEENLPHLLLSMAFLRQSKLGPPVHRLVSVAHNIHQNPSRKVTHQPRDNCMAVQQRNLEHVAVYQPFHPAGVSSCVSSSELNRSMNSRLHSE